MRNILAYCCEWLSGILNEAALRLRVCRECGENIYYGQPCIGKPHK